MNERRFDGRAEAYDAYRPSYPPALLDELYGEGGFRPASVVADVGAGTGIWSALLLQRGSQVFGVEPNAQMLDKARRRLADFARFVPVLAPGEATTLREHSVDFVTVAQAFHWLDAPRFRRECERILRPHGGIALIWNNRDMDAAINREWEALNRRLLPSFKGFSNGLDFGGGDVASFLQGKYEMRCFDNDVHCDRQAFLGRCLSSSYAPREGEAAYDPYVEALGDLFARCSQGGILCVPYRTLCCRKAPLR